jgi:hypothetical protein
MKEMRDQIKRSKLRWFVHSKRMDEHRMLEILKLKMSGRRPRDRPSKRWTDQVKSEEIGG